MPLYKQDPNDTSKQIPDVQGGNRQDRLVNPDRNTHTKSPNTLPVGFFFGSSASLSTAGNLDTANYTTALDDATVGTKLNIHPTAWSGSAADADKITFVYKSGLSTGGF